MLFTSGAVPTYYEIMPERSRTETSPSAGLSWLLFFAFLKLSKRINIHSHRRM
jgi:hypothetical protein